MRKVNSSILGALFLIPIAMGAASMVAASFGLSKLQSAVFLALGPQIVGAMIIMYLKLVIFKNERLAFSSAVNERGKYRTSYFVSLTLIAIGAVIELALIVASLKSN